MAYQPTRSKGTGKAGSKSSRWQKRADAKKAASKIRRVEDKCCVNCVPTRTLKG